MKILSIPGTDNILTLIKPSGRAVSLRAGDIVKAEVLDVMDSGAVSLRITPETGMGGIIMARTHIPMTKGTNILLKVLGGGKELNLQLVGMPGSNNKSILEMLSGISGSRPGISDLKLLAAMLRSVPGSIKSIHPEFNAIGKLMPGIERLKSDILKAAIEGSGVLFETRLRHATQGVKGPEPTAPFSSDTDLKGLLLKLKEILQNNSAAEALNSSGIKYSGMTGIIDRLIKNIEFFQLISRLNGIFCTYLPVSWDELSDGELSFKKNREGGKQSYTCDINLDIEPLGRLSVSVTLFEGAFHITFYAEKPDTKSLIMSGKAALEKKFSDAGLSLKIVNIGHKPGISFGAAKQQGLDLRV